MYINVEFKEDEITELIDMYLEKVKEKKAYVTELEKEIRNYNAKVSQLRHVLSNRYNISQMQPLAGDRIYSDKWQWVRKIEFAIESEGRALTSNEIYDFLVVFEPDFAKDKRKTISSISGTLSLKSGEYEDNKDFVRTKNDNGDFTYKKRKERISVEPDGSTEDTIVSEYKYEIDTKPRYTYGNNIEIDSTPF